MKSKPKILFISWAPYCSRSDNIAARLGGESILVYYGFLGSHYLTIGLKYLLQTLKTLIVLFQKQPDVVLVMSPPIVACFPVWIYCRIRKKSYIIDAHTAAFLHPRWKNRKILNRFFTKRALRTNVTNAFLAKIVRQWGGRPFMMSDVPVRFPTCPAPPFPVNPARPIVTLVNSFAPDEPLDAFLQATEMFDPDTVQFFITGKLPTNGKYPPQGLKPHVRFTDFLPDSAYGWLITNSTVACVFTLRDHTMLRGAYEAIYAGTPVVISHWPILKDKFPIGAVHVDHSPTAIARGIQTALAHHQELKQQADQLRQHKLATWDETQRQLLDLIGNTRWSSF